MGAELGIRGLQPWRRGPPLIGRCGSYSVICSVAAIGSLALAAIGLCLAVIDYFVLIGSLMIVLFSIY